MGKTQLFFSIAGLIAIQTVVLMLCIKATFDPFKSTAEALVSLVGKGKQP
jgi:hypothetical protein